MIGGFTTTARLCLAVAGSLAAIASVPAPSHGDTTLSVRVYASESDGPNNPAGIRDIFLTNIETNKRHSGLPRKSAGRWDFSLLPDGVYRIYIVADCGKGPTCAPLRPHWSKIRKGTAHISVRGGGTKRLRFFFTSMAPTTTRGTGSGEVRRALKACKIDVADNLLAQLSLIVKMRQRELITAQNVEEHLVQNLASRVSPGQEKTFRKALQNVLSRAPHEQGRAAWLLMLEYKNNPAKYALIQQMNKFIISINASRGFRDAANAQLLKLRPVYLREKARCEKKPPPPPPPPVKKCKRSGLLGNVKCKVTKKMDE